MRAPLPRRTGYDEDKGLLIVAYASHKQKDMTFFLLQVRPFCCALTHASEVTIRIAATSERSEDAPILAPPSHTCSFYSNTLQCFVFRCVALREVSIVAHSPDAQNDIVYKIVCICRFILKIERSDKH